MLEARLAATGILVIPVKVNVMEKYAQQILNARMMTLLPLITPSAQELVELQVFVNHAQLTLEYLVSLALLPHQNAHPVMQLNWPYHLLWPLDCAMHLNALVPVELPVPPHALTAHKHAQLMLFALPSRVELITMYVPPRYAPAPSALSARSLLPREALPPPPPAPLLLPLEVEMDTGATTPMVSATKEPAVRAPPASLPRSATRQPSSALPRHAQEILETPSADPNSAPVLLPAPPAPHAQTPPPARSQPPVARPPCTAMLPSLPQQHTLNKSRMEQSLLENASHRNAPTTLRPPLDALLLPNHAPVVSALLLEPRVRYAMPQQIHLLADQEQMDLALKVFAMIQPVYAKTALLDPPWAASSRRVPAPEPLTTATLPPHPTFTAPPPLALLPPAPIRLLVPTTAMLS